MKTKLYIDRYNFCKNSLQMFSKKIKKEKKKEREKNKHR
jgi:hypothetical protein